jgi:hypothetical protein
MAYYPDLTLYEYFAHNEASTQNVGWLERGHEFERVAPSEETLGLLWGFCTVSVMQSRGIHECDLCPTPRTVHAVRNGVKLLLGTSEIRVFSKDGGTPLLRRRLPKMGASGLLLLRGSAVPYSIFAAPTLIYHYVRTHHYKPPDEFLWALREGSRPPDPAYFEQLKKINLEWNETHSPPANPVRISYVRVDGEIRRVDEPYPVFVDES